MHIDQFTVRDDLLYVIPADNHEPDTVTAILHQHPEVVFVSLSGVDIAGNDTDEKIPVRIFLEEIEDYLDGGVQTDGSSVVLPGIASINNAEISLVADSAVNWYVDYNYENLDPKSGKPWGTLRIPAFLEHGGQRVCSRATLKRALDRLEDRLLALFHDHPELLAEHALRPEELAGIDLVSATELEFWVRTPDHIVNREHLSTSQMLKEQYWKRTKGVVRTALEQTLKLMELYGFEPEMGHKEVGGVKAHLTVSGTLDHILEQLEIDWRYSVGLQTADNELAIRILTKEIFRLHGLEASFMAKPIDGVAGNGEHLHFNVAARLHDGRRVNLFSPPVFEEDYLSVLGYGAIMGVLRHYRELVAPFVSASIDAFKRLQPGYEAPTHAAVSIGRERHQPSRNRTVLTCLVRHPASPDATRFELRSPHPHSNIYFTMASLIQVMLDGMTTVAEAGKSRRQLETELLKDRETAGDYLPAGRVYRSEEDLFTDFSEKERDRRFGRPASHVHETLEHLVQSPHLNVLFADGVFSDRLVRSYAMAMLDRWELELRDRVLEVNRRRVRDCQRLTEENDWDERLWQEISALREELAKTTLQRTSLFDRIREALDGRNLSLAASLHREMETTMEKLEKLDTAYRRNSLESL